MSLAPAPTPAGTTGPGAPARRGGQAVVAVVVTRGRSVYLPRALVCLAEQTLTPSAVVLVDTGPHDDPGIREMALRCGLAPETLTVVRAQGAPTFARAVRAGLAATETHPDQLFFLLHDDCYAQADCLSALARAIELAPSVVIAGPKQLRADLPDTLGEVGVTTSRFGRRMTGAKDGELDQGQYDQREDVLGVGSAGMLIRADAWAELGGLDPWLGPFGDGLDLSRRARLAGHRVIVVPGAVVNHEQAAYRGLRGKSGKPDPRRSFWSRRRAFVYTQLVGLPLPLVPVALVAAVVMGIGRAVWRVATKEPVLALAELWGPLRAVLHPWRIAAARRRARHTRRLRRSTLRPLQATQREVRQLRRDRRLARADAGRAATAPSEVELAELAGLARRRRRTLGFVAAGIALATVAALAHLLTHGRLAGGALADFDVSIPAAWRRATSSWISSGLGSPGPADPFTAVLALAHTISFGHGPWLLAIGAPLLAGFGAWFCAGALSRSTAVRTWATACWFSAPTLWLSLAGGRLGAAVAHAVLPWALLALIRALGFDRIDRVRREVPPEPRTSGSGAEEADAGAPDGADPSPVRPAGKAGRAAPARSGLRSATAAAASGLLLAVACAGAPTLLPLCLLGLVVAFFALKCQWRLVLVAAAPVTLFAQLILRAVRYRNWALLLTDPGLPVQSDPAPLWRVLLGWPAVPDIGDAWHVLGPVSLACSALIVLVALVALLRRGPRARAVRIAWAVVLLGLAGALVVARLGIVLTGSALIRPWAGGVTSLVTGGLLAAAVAGSDGAGAWIGSVGRARRFQAGLLAALMFLAPAFALGGAIWQQRSHTGVEVKAVTADPLPAIAEKSADGPDRTSTLEVHETETKTLAWRVVRGHGLTAGDSAASLWTITPVKPFAHYSRPISEPEIAGEAQVSRLVARLASGDPDQSLAGAVEAWGIGFIETAKDHTDLAAALDATPGLTRVAATKGGSVVWRVGDPTAPAHAAWARLVQPDGTWTALKATGAVIPPGVPGRTVVIAEVHFDGTVHWHATVGGKAVRSETAEEAQGHASEAGQQQAFSVPAAGGALKLWTPTSRALPVQAAVLLILVIVALPLRRRRAAGEARDA